MRVIAVATALAAFALGGCASYEPPVRPPGASLQRFEARRLDDPGLIALVATAPPAGVFEWNLETLTRAAIHLSPDLETARAQWRTSMAAIETAARRPNPSLDASAGRATNPPQGEPAGLADVALGIRIETAGKRGHRIAQARALSEGDRLDLQAAAWQLRGRIRDAMIDWRAAADEVALRDQQIAVDRSISRMLERRIELGESAMGEKVRADATLSRTRLARDAALSREGEARSRLAQAVGVPLQAIATAHISFDGLAASSALPGETPLRRAALARGDLRAALARFTAADAAYRLELARQYPDLELGPSYSYDTGTNKISLGVMALTLPVVDRNQGAIAQARARRDESAARFEAQQASVLAELDRAISTGRDAQSKQALARSIVQSEDRQLAAASRRFSAGEDDRLALASAQVAVYDAQAGELAATLALLKSIGQLEDAARMPIFTASGPARDVVEAGGER